eukprot:g9016.t1
MSHASIPAEKRTLPADLIRLSVGIEDAQDLILDLEQAIKVASGELCSNPHGGFDSDGQDLPVVPRIEGKPIIQDDDLSTRAPSALLKISGEASSDARAQSQAPILGWLVRCNSRGGRGSVWFESTSLAQVSSPGPVRGAELAKQRVHEMAAERKGAMMVEDDQELDSAAPYRIVCEDWLAGLASNTGTVDALWTAAWDADFSSLSRIRLVTSMSDQLQLAKVVLFDQIPRNVFRGTSDAFRYDEKACAASEVLIDSDFSRRCSAAELLCIVQPFVHAEGPGDSRVQHAIHILQKNMRRFPEDASNMLFQAILSHDAHGRVLRTFGRYPHRNTLLGRRSSPEELQPERAGELMFQWQNG